MGRNIGVYKLIFGNSIREVFVGIICQPRAAWLYDWIRDACGYWYYIFEQLRVYIREDLESAERKTHFCNESRVLLN